MFTTFKEDVVDYIFTHPSPFHHVRVQQKLYFISKDFEWKSGLYFQDGDGYCAYY
jgi:hypothetical protein